MRDAYNNPSVEHAKQVWDDKWSDQHAEWQPPVMAYGALPLKDGYLSCFEQHAKQGNQVRVFAVVEGTDRALAISYNAASKNINLQDDTGILSHQDALTHEILNNDAIDIAAEPLSKKQGSHAAAYLASKDAAQARAR